MFDLLSVLSCPVCHEGLRQNPEGLFCGQCQQTYANDKGILSFISRNMYQSQQEYQSAMDIIEFWGKGWEKRLSEPEHEFLRAFGPDELRDYARKDIINQIKDGCLMDQEQDFNSLKGKVALNIGCGCGFESLILAYSGAYCIGMDITKPAAASAVYCMNKIGASGTGIQADSRFIPVKSNSVEVVYSNGVLHHSPDIQHSIHEVYRVLKPGGTAYIMLYATWSLKFMQERLIGILKGNISRKQQLKYMSSHSEHAWITGRSSNPHTQTFTKKECKILFKDFVKMSVRKGSFSLRDLAVIRTKVPAEKLDRFTRKYASYLEPYLGSNMYIKVVK